MKKEIYLCWVEDGEAFIESMGGNLELLEMDFNVRFVIDQHYNTDNLELIARNITDDVLFLVDYNLRAADGAGVDGDEVIRFIRRNNTVCRIIFYSSNATQQDLRKLVEEQPNIVCVIREELTHCIREVLDGGVA